MESNAVVIKKKCNSCEKDFICNGSEINSSCWCEPYPKEVLLEKREHCFCLNCLSNSISHSITRLIEEKAHEEALRIARSFQDHSKLFLDIDYTIEDGKYVYTKWYLLKRGFCCRGGCRNCPYSKE